MVHRTVLKVKISCQKCKQKVLTAVSGVEGVDKVEIDAGKGVLTVTGTADPYEVITRVKRTERLVEVVSVGPSPKSDDKKPDHKEKEKEKEKITSLPKVCERCGRAYIHVGKAEEPNLTCSVM